VTEREQGGRADGVDAPVNTTADAPSAAIRVVTGSPTDVELAAANSVLMAVLAAQADRGAELIEPPVDLWRRSGRAMRTSLAAGPGSWTAAGTLRGF